MQLMEESAQFCNVFDFTDGGWSNNKNETIIGLLVYGNESFFTSGPSNSGASSLVKMDAIKK